MRRKTIEDITAGCLPIATGMVLAMLFCLVLSLCSCKPIKEIQVERVEVPVVVTQEHTVEHTKIDHVRDTLIQRDSIYHYIKGDTTIIERWHYLQGTTKVAKVDTFIKVDSVPYPVITTKEVVEVKEVNILHWWQKMLIAIGGGSLIALALLITYRLRKRT